MPKTESRADEPRLLRTFKADVERIAADVRKHGVRQHVGATLGELEAFYLSEDTKRRLASMNRVRRLLYRIGWLLKSLLLKLTPARRVMLAVGLVCVAFQLRVDAWGLSLEFRQIGIALLLIVLMLELKDKLVARDELEAGRRVQLALMPERSPAVPGWSLWLYTEPANDVGGDLVDYLPLDAAHYGIALGDVAGKALPAALLMMKLQATLRALAPHAGTLDELGASVNHILVRDGLPNRFATLVYLVLPNGSGPVRLLNAGHLPPRVVRTSGVIEELARGSIALGMVPGASFGEQQVHVAAGDVLVVVSDGITEATNAAGDFFGDERLRAVLVETAGHSVEAIGGRILGAVENFVAGAPVHDDVSVIVIKRQHA